MVLTYCSLLVGHSAGVHRMMIHRTFKCPSIVEKFLIYIGVLVGMSGPYGIIRIHDTRDWAQRQKTCHPYFSHTESYWRDTWWQLTSRFVFERAPVITIEPHYAKDPFYQWLKKTWRFHQVPLAVLLFILGGWSFVVWGVFVRIAVSILGHWTITCFCHNPGPGKWRVTDAGAQASNIPGLGLLTYGECWHNNHHAFPESAQIGLDKNQSDPAFTFIKLLEKAGLASDISVPRPQHERDDLAASSEALVIDCDAAVDTLR
ncbi:MAG: fatty acid desaturase [Gammaproteobacteria bacterium]